MSVTRVFYIGDLHRRFEPVYLFNEKVRKKYPDTDKVILVCLGDFGGNIFFNHLDVEFKKKLGTYNIEYFVIRGNHEERPENCALKAPSAWEQEIYFGNLVWVEKEYPYIKYALDHPTAYLINKHFTFVVPGAYSVDKYYRLQNGKVWFEDEQLTPIERIRGRYLAENLEKCDIILSHTCPVVYEPTDLFLKQVDQSMVDKTMERYLGEIETRLQYRIWLWGHYHSTRVYPSWNNSDRVMLFNDKVFDIDTYFKNNNPYDCLIDINLTN